MCGKTHFNAAAENVNEGFPLEVLRNLSRETSPMSCLDFGAVLVLLNLQLPSLVVSGNIVNATGRMKHDWNLRRTESPKGIHPLVSAHQQDSRNPLSNIHIPSPRVNTAGILTGSMLNVPPPGTNRWVDASTIDKTIRRFQDARKRRSFLCVSQLDNERLATDSVRAAWEDQRCRNTAGNRELV